MFLLVTKHKGLLGAFTVLTKCHISNTTLSPKGSYLWLLLKSELNHQTHHFLPYITDHPIASTKAQLSVKVAQRLFFLLL